MSSKCILLVYSLEGDRNQIHRYHMAVGTAWAKGQWPYNFLQYYSPSSKVLQLTTWRATVDYMADCMY